jgi:hypothetical protein
MAIAFCEEKKSAFRTPFSPRCYLGHSYAIDTSPLVGHDAENKTAQFSKDVN